MTDEVKRGEAGAGQLKCAKCAAVFDEELEFCPQCKSPALWSRPDFQAQRLRIKENPQNWQDEYKYAKQLSDTPPAKRQWQGVWERHSNKIILFVVVAVVLFTSAGYLLDQQHFSTTPEQEAAIELVRQSHAVDPELTVEQIFDDMVNGKNSSVVRVIGWTALRIEDGVYYVTYGLDDDYTDANGWYQYYFEAVLSSGEVRYGEDIRAKYEELGYLNAAD